MNKLFKYKPIIYKLTLMAINIGFFQQIAAYADTGYSVSDYSKALLINKDVKGKEISGSLGKITLIGGSKFKGLISEKLILDAFQIAKNTLTILNFPANLSEIQYPWRIAAIEIIPKSTSRIKNSFCHLLQMGPPADIYLNISNINNKFCLLEKPSVEQQIFVNLVHEIAHVIEYHLMGKAYSRRQRWHSEGFALWFQTEALKILNNKALNQYYSEKQLNNEIKNLPSTDWLYYTFSGSREDYLRSYLIIRNIINKISLPEFINLYQMMSDSSSTFEGALAKQTGGLLPSAFSGKDN